MNTNFATQVKIWASTSRGTPDNIYIGGKKIGKYTLPKIPNKKYIGLVNLKTPQVSSTNPTNLMTDVSRTTPIVIKFSENIKTSTYFKNINIKDLTTNKYLAITETINGNTLNIQTTATRNVNTWYQVTIPAAAIKDIAGNNLLATYTFKFKTGFL